MEIEFSSNKDFPGGSDGKNICLQCRRAGFDPWVGKIPWRRKWQPTPVFLPGKSHGQRSLAGCSPWGRKESDTTEWLHFHFHFRENVTKRNKWTIFYPSVMKYNLCLLHIPWGFPDGASGKGSTSQHMRNKRHVFSPWVGTIPWRRKWQPTPLFLPGESHGQRSLAGYGL